MTQARSNPRDVTLHRTIASVLRSEISEGVLRQGARLPSEEALRLQFSVSRSTVRQALEALERDGLIERQVGRGTFVRYVEAQTRPVRLTQDWQAVVAQAERADRTVRQGEAPPSAQVEAIFACPDPVPFSILVRHDAPAFAVKRHVAAAIGDKAIAIASSPDFGAALSEALEKEAVITEFWADAILAEPRFAMLLKVPAGSALHSFWWVYRCAGRPVACVQMLVPGGGYSLNVVGAGL